MPTRAKQETYSYFFIKLMKDGFHNGKKLTHNESIARLKNLITSQYNSGSLLVKHDGNNPFLGGLRSVNKSDTPEEWLHERWAWDGYSSLLKAIRFAYDIDSTSSIDVGNFIESTDLTEIANKVRSYLNENGKIDKYHDLYNSLNMFEYNQELFQQKSIEDAKLLKQFHKTRSNDLSDDFMLRCANATFLPLVMSHLHGSWPTNELSDVSIQKIEELGIIWMRCKKEVEDINAIEMDYSRYKIQLEKLKDVDSTDPIFEHYAKDEMTQDLTEFFKQSEKLFKSIEDRHMILQTIQNAVMYEFRNSIFPEVEPLRDINISFNDLALEDNIKEFYKPRTDSNSVSSDNKLYEIIRKIIDNPKIPIPLIMQRDQWKYNSTRDSCDKRILFNHHEYTERQHEQNHAMSHLSNP